MRLVGSLRGSVQCSRAPSWDSLIAPPLGLQETGCRGTGSSDPPPCPENGRNLDPLASHMADRASLNGNGQGATFFGLEVSALRAFSRTVIETRFAGAQVPFQSELSVSRNGVADRHSALDGLGRSRTQHEDMLTADPMGEF